MDKRTTEDDFWKNESVALLALASLQGVGYWMLYKLAKTRQSFKQVFKIGTKEAFVAAFKDLGSRTIKLSEAEWSQQQETIWHACRQMYHHLTRKVTDLELFHDLAVGRELKLIELEREVERLKGRREERSTPARPEKHREPC